MKIGKYTVEVYNYNTYDDNYGWIDILPSIEYRHKYWYFYELTFHWWKWGFKVEIYRNDI